MSNVIVTGGSRGLGLGIASSLAAGGYRVIAIARTESEELRTAIAGVGANGPGGPGGPGVPVVPGGPGSLHFRAFDLADTGAIASFVSALRKEFGPVFGLVNNAGLGTAGVLAMMREEQIEQLVRLNVTAPIILSKYVVRSMMIERTGRIINISSIVGSTGYSGLSAYAATKASMLGFTRSLAREVGPLGITVNAIAPGFADTEMTRDMGEGQREQIIRRSALRRLIDVGDIAAAVQFLFSEQARNITGTTLTIDAGNTA